MQLFIDSSSPDEIRQACEWGLKKESPGMKPAVTMVASVAQAYLAGGLT